MKIESEISSCPVCNSNPTILEGSIYLYPCGRSVYWNETTAYWGKGECNKPYVTSSGFIARIRDWLHLCVINYL